MHRKDLTALTWVLLLAAAVLSACGPSVQHTVREDWPQQDARRVKRLALVVAPVDTPDAPAAQLWSRVARRWVNQHRDFLVRVDSAAGALDLPAACSQDVGGPPTEGVLHLTPRWQPVGDGTAVELQGRLLRCADGEPVWSGRVAGSWQADDDLLTQMRALYGRELGPEVEPLVAPAFRSVSALLETLPQPVLDDEDQMEKIELGE